jgi:hypothetical protein
MKGAGVAGRQGERGGLELTVIGRPGGLRTGAMAACQQNENCRDGAGCFLGTKMGEHSSPLCWPDASRQLSIMRIINPGEAKLQGRSKSRPFEKKQKCKFNKTKNNRETPVSCPAGRRRQWGTNTE